MVIKAGHMALLRTEEGIPETFKDRTKRPRLVIASDFPYSRNLTTEVKSYW